MSWQRLWTVAAAEMRLTRRLVRYWVFLALGYLLGIGGYLYYSALHGFFSSYSATVASIGPRYLIGAVGLYYLMVFMIGLVFLGFDLRARDQRERVVEVLDSRPVTNLELVGGRFLGLLLMAWVPVLALAGVIQLLGLLLKALGAPLGEPVEPVSLIAFTVFMALPAFAFTLAVVFLVTLLVRHRLVASVLALAVLGGLVFASFRLPIPWGPLVDITGAYIVNFPSDMLPGIADAVGWLQRLGYLALGLGLIGVAAALHPRLDGGARGQRLGASVALAVVAVAMLGAGVWSRHAALDRLETWREAHAARTGEPLPDVERMTGLVRIDPGDRLELELEVSFRAPQDHDLERALFTLNPGFDDVRVELTDGTAVAVSHADGLLELTLPSPLAAGESTVVRVTAAGRPDTWFGYLDAAIVPEALTAIHGQIFLLGFERSLNRSSFVALMPGIGWLPASGPAVAVGHGRTRPRDFFELELEVETPAGFLVAGPGRRQLVSAGGDTARFRFAPGAPVPEAALVAGRFVSSEADIEGVHLELLLHPDHTDNMERLEDAAAEVEAWIAERLKAAADAGLPYPYDGFTMVEVPTSLRGFGGGWRLDTVLAPPAMLLMRESGFPTARFDVPFRKPERFQDQEGGVPRAKRDRLVSFFVNDFSGGNLFIGSARSFFRHLTAPAGDEALALEFVLDELATLVLSDSRGYFSAHMFSPELNQSIGTALQSYFTSGRRDGNFADSVIEAFTSRPQVWSAVLGTSLADLDPTEEPQRAFDALTLKGGALAQSLYDSLGAEATGRLLSALRERFAGGTFTLDAVVAVAAELGEDVGPMLADWLTTTDLPGFVIGAVELVRLPDQDGAARYQLSVEVRNDEPAPGMLRMVVATGSGDDTTRDESDPIRIGERAAVRWSTVLSRPPESVEVEPYLSLNRETFRVELPALDESRVVSAEPEVGVEAVEWAPPDRDTIVVDDLDPGFTAVDGSGRSGLRLAGRGLDSETDDGLPLVDFGPLPSTWSRATSATAWGRYRHTVAYVRAGAGEGSASFATELPSGGSWELAIHLPHKERFRQARKGWGSWALTVTDVSGEAREASFDAGAADRGWSPVGSFDLLRGEVTVTLSDATEGQVVVADAIRWRPAAGATKAEE